MAESESMRENTNGLTPRTPRGSAARAPWRSMASRRVANGRSFVDSALSRGRQPDTWCRRLATPAAMRDDLDQHNFLWPNDRVPVSQDRNTPKATRDVEMGPADRTLS
jgi:hypothetical protein